MRHGLDVYTKPPGVPSTPLERGDQGGSAGVLGNIMRFASILLFKKSTFWAWKMPFFESQHGMQVQPMGDLRRVGYLGPLGMGNEMQRKALNHCVWCTTCTVSPICVAHAFCCQHMQNQHICRRHLCMASQCSSIANNHAKTTITCMRL